MSFPGNINLNNLASLMASAGGAGAFPGLNAAAMAAAAASQPAADGATSAGGAGSRLLLLVCSMMGQNQNKTLFLITSPSSDKY